MAGCAGGASARQRLHVWPLSITPSVRGEEPFASQMSHTGCTHVKKKGILEPQFLRDRTDEGELRTFLFNGV